MNDRLGEAAERALSVPVSSVNILVVQDNPANRIAFEGLLQPLGYSVFLASSGQEALILASRYRFAVVLLDVRMPDMDGLETATCLRRKPFCRTTPIVFMSAHPETALDVSRSALEGPTGYIFSPVDSEILVWKVKNCVDLFLRIERVDFRAAYLWHASEQFRKLLDASPKAEPELRESGARLAKAVEDLKEVLAERSGPSVD